MSRDPIRDPGRMRRLGVATAVLAVALLALWVQREFRPVRREIRALRSEQASARLAAADALGRGAPADASAALPALADALRDADDGVRAAAARSLGSAGCLAIMDPSARGSVRVAVDAMSRALTDRTAEVRAAAAGAIGQLAGPVPTGGTLPFDVGTVADALAKAMGDPSVEVRTAAGQTLSALAVKTGIAPPSALLAALGPVGSAELRKEAMAILLPAFRTHVGEVIPLLVDALEDSDPSLRFSAARVLGGAGPAAQVAIPALIAILGEPVGPGPAAPSVPAIARLRAEFSPDRWDPACEAARALARIAQGADAGASQEAVAALASTLRSEHAWRRNAAAEGLFLIGQGAAAATPALASALAESVTAEGPGGQGSNSWAARALGLAAPGTAAEAEAIAALTRGLDSSAQGTRAYSADSLARFGPRASSALPRLRALRDGPDRFVSAMARSAVARLEGAPVPVGPADH
jgi:HEAT repeat protein